MQCQVQHLDATHYIYIYMYIYISYGGSAFDSVALRCTGSSASFRTIASSCLIYVDTVTACTWMSWRPKNIGLSCRDALVRVNTCTIYIYGYRCVWTYGPDAFIYIYIYNRCPATPPHNWQKKQNIMKGRSLCTRTKALWRSLWPRMLFGSTRNISIRSLPLSAIM